MDTTQRQQDRPTVNDAMIAAEALHFIGLLCRTQGLDVRIAILDLPRNVFDTLDDDLVDRESKKEQGYRHVLDGEHPYWWKQYAEFLNVFTHQPPKT